MVKALLITANVGSLFDDADRLRTAWLSQLAQAIRWQQPDFVALHLQETGGKHFEQYSHTVVPLVQQLFREIASEFSHCYAFLDLAFEKTEQFTALGSVFFVRAGFASQTRLFDFSERRFAELDVPGFYESQATDACSSIQKQKFSRDFWPGVRWGRKGYLHTRWALGSRIFDLINVHLFHDESNLAFHENPAQYSNNRRKAMNFVLEQYNAFISQARDPSSPLLFLFGDFNFRLNAISFLKKLTDNSHEHFVEASSDTEDSPKTSSDDSEVIQQTNGHVPLQRQISAIEYRSKCKEPVLRIEKKKFDYRETNLVKRWRDYIDDDQEPSKFPLKEEQISFPPTYPWSEDPLTHHLLMKTRMPAWCDRVLMREDAWRALSADPHRVYSIIGANVCMGDHKPVFLAFRIH